MTELNHDDLDAIMLAMEHYDIYCRNAIWENAANVDTSVYRPQLKVFRETRRWVARVMKKVEKLRAEMEKENRTYV